jgi:hypothetical protein
MTILQPSIAVSEEFLIKKIQTAFSITICGSKWVNVFGQKNNIIVLLHKMQQPHKNESYA